MESQMKKGDSVESVKKHRSKKTKGSKEKVKEKLPDLPVEELQADAVIQAPNSTTELKLNAEQLALLQLEQEATLRSVERRTDSSRALQDLESQYTTQLAREKQSLISPRNNRSFFAVDATRPEVPLATYQEGKLTRTLSKMKGLNKSRGSITLNSSSDSLGLTNNNSNSGQNSSGLNSPHSPHGTAQPLLQITTWNCLSTDQEIEKSYVSEVKPHLRWRTGRKQLFAQYWAPLASLASLDQSARKQNNSTSASTTTAASALSAVATAVYALQEVTEGMVKVALKSLAKHASKHCSYDSVFRCRNKVLSDGCAILYDREQLKLVQTVEKPFENGTSIMLAGHFLVKATNCNFWVITTSINWETRLGDIALLKNQVLDLEPKCTKFIAGNFESQPSESWYNLWINNANIPIIDTYHYINEKAPDWTFNTGYARKVVDFVFTVGVEKNCIMSSFLGNDSSIIAPNFAKITSLPNAEIPSDHLPISTVVQLGR